MNINTVHKNILKFAIEPVSYNFFIEKLKESRSDNPINCWYTTEEGNNRRYTMYWNPSAYVGTEASLTKEDNDMYNLQGDYPGGDWRTLDTLTVSRFRYENRTYIVE
jgi:hypothetical protein